ncbi:hypothetical protein KUCAC02_007967 [Chaenocephalus aceratus]|uniref:Uncharacterized protein n=1 Tax=Chaenocephalus aceratus TaxID=36190 RepID=A0ACB9X8D2_CHAAC|nr:hypothetical protein KUCAC02_007967 [Chaenocephalus aceratus]
MSKAKGKQAEKGKGLLLDGHRAALTADFKSSFESLTSTLDSIHSTITDRGNANEVDQRLQQLENACSALKGDNETLKTKLDRAHRSLAPKPAPGGRPRPVILRFHRFQIKDLVIREARRQGELNCKGHKIRLYDDYSPDVLKQRAEYRSPMAELYKPKLRITLPNGNRTWLMSAPEAVKFVQDLNIAP